MKLPPEFEDELARLPDLREVGTALAVFAAIIAKLDDYERDSSGRWVGRPTNFVTFKVQWKMSRDIAVTLRGYASEFKLDADIKQVTKPGLEPKDDRTGYSRVNLKSASQLAACAAYIAQALEIYRERGGSPRRT